MKKTSQWKKNLAFFLIAVFLFSILYFHAYEAAQETHRCTKDRCPICQQLHMAEAFTKQVLPTFSGIHLIFILLATRESAGKIFSGSVSERNLITDKVRLDD